MGRLTALAVCVLTAALALRTPPPASAATGAPAPRHLGPPAPAAFAVTLAPTPAGSSIPASFLGLSIEDTALAAPVLSTPYPVLAGLLGDLGEGVLRLSGDSADFSTWLPRASLSAPAPAPAPWSVASVDGAALTALAALMAQSHWHLLLGLDLGHLQQQALVEEAHAAAGALGEGLAGLEIGNEPDLYAKRPPPPFRALLGELPLRPASWSLQAYLSEYRQMREALTAAGVSARLYGPDTATGAWLTSFAAAEGAQTAALTGHLYPLDRCVQGRVVGASLRSLLGRGVAALEARHIDALAAAALNAGLPLRIDETNSVACGGQPHLSDTFASALWALDYSLIAAERGISGLNFHGGLGSCAIGGSVSSPWYSPLCVLPDGLPRARPEFYALLLVRALEGDRFLPVHYATPRDVSVYALQAPDGSLRIVIDDLESTAARTRRHPHPRPPGAVRIAVRAPLADGTATIVRLTAPGLLAETGVRLGGARIAPDGSFTLPAGETVEDRAGLVTVSMTPGSAALLTLAAR